MPPGTKIFDVSWVLGHLPSIWDRIVQHLTLTAVPLRARDRDLARPGDPGGPPPGDLRPDDRDHGPPVHDPEPRRVRPPPPIFGLSLITAFIPLTTYTLLIPFRAFTAGFAAVPTDILEAAEGMGYTRRERLLGSSCRWPCR
jgi:hypothetical protein